jgi:RNA polymerase sigma-54 factor
MAIGPRMEMRQGQSLVMTPAMQQAIKMLPMSNIDLQAFLESELERNPLLELDDGSEVREAPASHQADTVPEVSADPPPEDGYAGYDGEADGRSGGAGEPVIAGPGGLGPQDSNWSSVRSGGGAGFDGDDMEFASTISREETLVEHLSQQLSLAISDPADLLIGQHIIGMVNEAGYLTGDTAGIADMLGTSVAHVDRVLAVMQQFDPPGVFARDMRECLMLQLIDRNRYDPAMAKLLDNLKLLGERNYAALRSICEVDRDDLAEMIDEIHKLEPKPGRQFGSDPVQPIIADVIVRGAPDGSWIVELNSETLPKVLVHNSYAARVSKSSTREEDKLFISKMSEYQAHAKWLVESLDHRANTILKVAREIVRQQDAFLVHGVQQLRPLNLRNVADAIGMHESTVSRVTSNKYMATPRGIFEMKFFFTRAIAATDAGDEAHSAEAVRHRIRELVAAEGEAVLSDDDLVGKLKQDGIEIARRTIAKYRESLGIRSSVQRRREWREKHR